MKSAFVIFCALWVTTVATAFSPKSQQYLMANTGQWEEKIIARYQTATAVTQLTKDGLEIHLLDANNTFGVALRFSGHNPNSQIQAHEEVAYKEHFLHGQKTYSAKAHRKYVYKSLYEGIDWHVLVDEDGQLKHEFHLAPFADPGLIQWTYEGQRGIQLAASGALRIQTPLGDISESKPISWQVNNLKAIASTFKLNKNKSLSFELGNYDRSKAIVIDPVLRWSTYIGGANTEKAWDVAVHEASGKVFVVGEGNSPALNTIGTTAPNRIQSAYVACFDAAGNQLWLTFLGVPPGLTAAQSISISQDANPAIYVAGTAQGADNSIATAGAHKAVRSGQSDIFLARLDSAGQVQWGTYFGSTSSDFDPVIRLNNSGTKLYVGGTTTGNNGIASAGVHRAARQSDFQTHEGFVAVFSNTGQFERGSYVNGASEVSRVYALALRGDSVLVGGATSGGSVFGTGGSYTTLGGARDGFMMMFNPNLGFVFSSFIGGSGNDDVFALALTSDAIYVGGETFSSNRMATSGAAQLSFGGNSDAFLMRFNLNGQIQWGTYLGGVVADGFKDIVVSNDNFIYALGRTTSPGNIAFNAMQTALNGSANVLLAKYNSQGARQFSTYLGAGEMVGEGLAMINTGKRIYMAGRALSGNFSTAAAFNQTRQGEDGFLTAVTDSRAEILSINPHCLNSPVTYRLLTSNLLAGDSVFIRALDAFSNIINVDTIIYSSGDTLTRTIPASRLTGLTGQQLALDARLNAGTPNRFPAGTAWVTAVNQLSIPSQVSSPQNICSGSNISLWLTTAGGRNRRIVWEKDGVVLANQPPANDPTAITFQVNAQSAGTYRARVTDDCGADLYTQPMVVNALAAPALLAIANQNSCTGGSLTLTASGTDTLTGKTYLWQRNGLTIANSSDSVLRLTNLTTAQAGNYTVRATGNGCTSNIVSFTVQVKAALSAGFKPGAQRLCPGNSLSIALSSSNHDSIRWFLNNQLIAGASSTTYSKSNISTADAGVFKAQIFYCDSVVTFDSISVEVSNTFSADDGLTHYFPFDNSTNEIITRTAPVSSSISYGNGRQATQAAGRNAVMAGNGLTYNGLNVPTANQAFSVSFYHRLELTSAFGTLLEWTWPSTGTNAFRITRNALFGYQLTFAGQTDVVNLTGIGTFDAWIHTTVTYDGQVLRCFINGQQQFVKNISWQASGTGQLQIGRGASGNINRISIDEVRVYNRALSTQEINVLKDQPEVVYTESTLSSCGSDSIALAATVFPSNTNNGFQWLAEGQAIAGATNLQQSILAANNTARKFKLNTKLAGCFEIGSGQIEVVDTVSITNGLLDLWSYAFSIPQGGGTGNLFYANVSSFSNDRFNRSNGALLITAKTAGATYSFGSAQPRLSYMIWYRHNQAGNTNQLSTLFSNDAYSHLSFYNDRLVAPGNANNLTPLSNDTLVDNQWYHVAVTFEGTTYRYYLNGRLIATRTGQPNIDNNQINGIFNRSTVGGQGALGAFNDLRVYNYRVSPSLLNQLYYQPLLATAGSSSLCEGGSTTEQMRDRYFPASAFQFQWYRNNVLLAGSTTDALQFSNVSRTDSGVYSVEVSGPCLSTARRNQFTLNVLPIAQVLTQPTNITVCTGDTLRVNLSIDESVAVSSVIWFNAATGNSRFSNLFSQSAVGNRSFVKANASLADTGLYVAQIRTTNGGCQIYSDTIRVSISAPPSLQLTALDTTLCLGTNFSLGGLTGGGTTSRQWFKNGQAIPGATADTLQLSNLDSTASGTYRLVAVAACRTDTSQNIVIRLRENLSITTQPQSQTLCVGDTLQLSVQPNTSAGVQIQWYKDGVAISGANNATYSLASVQNSLEGLYHAEVRDNCKVLQSDTATVLINALPAITTQSARLQTVCLGDSISLNVGATGGRLQYQWFKNGSSLNNQQAATLSFSSITAQDSGSYRLQISNSCGQVFSDTFQLLVPVTPIVTQQPVGGSFCQGASVTLTVAGNQLQNVNGLQWFKNQSPIAGATSLNYTIAAFGASDSASYQLRLFTNCDTIVSNAAVLQYIQPAVRTGNLSANSVYCLGQSLNLTFNVSNASLEWFKNGQRISNAPNSTTFNISALAFADSGYYQAVATSQCDTFVSDSVFIRIIEAPFLLGNPMGAGAFCSGSAVNLSHQIGGNINDAQFQWFKDGQSISGANQSSLAISQLGIAQVGRYTLQLTSACGVQTSDTFNVRIYQAVQFTSTNSSTNSFCAGDSTGLSLSFSGDVNSFQWYRNNQLIANANSNSYLIPAFNAQFAGNYFCVVTGPCNTDTSATFDLLLEVAPQISSAMPAVQSFCTGDSVRLQANFSGTNLTYQWHVNGQLQAQNSSALALLAQGGDSLKISVRANHQCGQAFDSTLILVRPITAITQQPSAPASLCIGSGLSLQATAAGHNLSYQWTRDGSPISGATQPIFNIASLSSADAGSYRLIVNGSCGTDTSVAVLVQSLALTSIVSQPQNANSCLGSATTFRITALGAGLSYTWLVNGTAQNVNADSLVLNPSTIGTFNVRAIVTGSCGTDTSSMAVLEVRPITAITQQPSAPASLCIGSGLSLQATVAGHNLSYQWTRNGSPINGATQPGLNFTSLTSADAGSYRLIATGSCGSDTSVAVVVQPLALTSIVSQPQNANSCLGSATTFRITALGAGLSYTWLVNGTAQSVNTDSLVLNPAVIGTFNVRAIVTGSCGTDTSSMAMLEVRPVTAITQQPSVPASLCIGSGLSLQATAAGHNLSYQWTRNGSPINGATQPGLNFTSLTSADAGSYRLIVNGSCGTDTSVAVLVQSLALTSIVSQPQNANSCLGSATTFRITALGAGLSYTWLVNGTAQNVNADSLVLNPVSIGTLNIRAIVTGSCGTDTSSMAVLEVRPITAITQQPSAPASLCIGSTLNLQANAVGHQLSYQWTRNGSPINVATQPGLNFTSLTSADAGTYRLIATGSCGTDTSVAVLVQPLALTSIVSQPQNAISCLGNATTFRITALGAGLSYTWLVNGTAQNVNADSLVLNPVSIGTFNVRAIVTGSCGIDTSSMAVLEVRPVTAITQQPTAPAVICDGSPLSLQATAIGLQLSYQWTRNGIPIAGANQATLNINSFSTLNAGIYRLIVNGSCGSDTSVALNIQPTLNTGIISGPQNATSCLGNPTTFRLQVQGAGLNYSWTVNGVFQNVNADSLVLNPTTAGVYQIQAILTGTCGSFISNIALLEVQPATIITQQPTAPAVICEGSPLSLQAAANGLQLSYQWTRNGIAIAGATQPTFSIANFNTTNSGIYQLIVNGSCGSDTSVALNLQPVLNTGIVAGLQNQTSCVGTPVTFRTQVQGSNLSYNWLVNGIAQNVNADSLVLNPSAAGNYTVRLILTGSCGADSSTATLTLNANSTDTISAAICASDVYNFFGQPLNIAGSYQATIPNSQGCDSLITLQLTVNPNPLPLVVNNAGTLSTDSFVSYQWFLDGIALPGDTLRNLQPTQNGQYQVEVVDSFGCTGQSDSVAVIGLSIQEQRANNLRLYPVPAKSSVFVILDMNKSQTRANLRSSTGQLIRTVLLEAGQNELIIDDLADGLYYLECESQVKRFIRQH